MVPRADLSFPQRERWSRRGPEDLGLSDPTLGQQEHRRQRNLAELPRQEELSQPPPVNLNELVEITQHAP